MSQKKKLDFQKNFNIKKKEIKSLNIIKNLSI